MSARTKLLSYDQRQRMLGSRITNRAKWNLELLSRDQHRSIGEVLGWAIPLADREIAQIAALSCVEDDRIRLRILHEYRPHMLRWDERDLIGVPQP